MLAALAGCGKSDEELARQWEVVHAQTFRAGLKILCPLKTCGFDSHLGHEKRQLHGCLLLFFFLLRL